MLICILTKNVITSCSITIMLFLLLEVKPLMTLTTLLYFSFALTATPQIYTLSLHDALPISQLLQATRHSPLLRATHPSRSPPFGSRWWTPADRKSTRLNSSHSQISYAVFCLKK